MSASAATLRPSSSPSTFASPPLLPSSLPPPPSLGSLINMSALEHYLTSLHSRVQAQEAALTSLTSALHSTLPLSSFSTFSTTLLSHIEAQDQKIADLQSTIDTLTAQQPTLSSHSALLAQHAQQLQATPSTSDLTSALSSLSATLTTSLADLRASTPSLTSFHQLQSSLHLLLTQTSHLQSLLADKVDRAELPLLEGVEERVKTMVEGLDSVEGRVQGLEGELKDVRREVEGKESREEASQRLSVVEEQLKGRVTLEWVEEHVVDDLREVQDELLRFAAHDETMRRVLEEQRELHARVHSHHSVYEGVSADVGVTRQRMEEVEARLREKLDVAVFERCRREDGQQLDKQLHTLQARTGHIPHPAAPSHALSELSSASHY